MFRRLILASKSRSQRFYRSSGTNSSWSERPQNIASTSGRARIESSLREIDELSPGGTIDKYIVRQVTRIPDFQLTAVELEHRTTAAQHLHLARDDGNNVFSVGFRTIPMDSTGVPHILEHTVLCGSKSFPCRDPFFKMLNRSLSTFMNAFTSCDYTLYPFSTQNEQDFKNLLSVYLDAVFFPLLKEMDFRQEGWRLEPADVHDKESPIIFKGVVFNEMKGHFSDSDSIFLSHLQRKLYPGHTYSNEYGGYPLDIPNLTWQQLRDFHSKHYHPSNAVFFTYGDMSLKSHLREIDRQVLSHFTKGEKVTAVPLETRWTAPRESHISCAPDAMAPDPAKQTTVALSFLLKSMTDLKENLLIALISHLLVDGQASPFYQSLIESNVGSNFSPGTGVGGHLKEMSFSIGLQGINEEDVENVKERIWETFKKVAEEGFPEDRIKAFLHQLELSQKHQGSNFGLQLISSMMPLWNHGGRVSEALKISERVEQLKETLQSHPEILKEKVKEYFLDNPHCLTLIMSPEQDYESNLQRLEQEKLNKYVSKLTGEDRQTLIKEGIEMENRQSMEEDVSILPTLQIADISREGVYPVLCHDFAAGTPVQLTEQPTNGIVYFKALSSITSLPDDLMDYVPLFCSVITSLGAGDMDHRDFSEECNLRTGGLGVTSHIACDHSDVRCFEQSVLFSSHSLEKNLPYMFSLWTTLFKSPKFEDLELLGALIKMAASNLSSEIAYSGHHFAMMSSAASLTPAGGLSEQFGGITQAAFLKRQTEEDVAMVAKKLGSIAAHVFDCSQMRCSLNATSEGLEKALPSLDEFIRALPGSPHEPSPIVTVEDFKPISKRLHHVMPFPINYVSTSLPGAPYSNPDAAKLRVLSRLMTNKFLHREIREKGGAYGGGAKYGGGVFSFYSYRDPNCLETLENFNQSIKWILCSDFTQRDIDEAKLGIFSMVDSPVSPGNKGSAYFLSRITKEMMEAHRQELIGTDKDDLIEVANKYLNSNSSISSSSIIGPSNAKVSSTKEWTVIDHRDVQVPN